MTVHALFLRQRGRVHRSAESVRPLSWSEAPAEASGFPSRRRARPEPDRLRLIYPDCVADSVFDSSQASVKIRVRISDPGSPVSGPSSPMNYNRSSSSRSRWNRPARGRLVSLPRGMGATDYVLESDGSLHESPERSLSNALVTGRRAGNYRPGSTAASPFRTVWNSCPARSRPDGWASCFLP